MDWVLVAASPFDNIISDVVTPPPECVALSQMLRHMICDRLAAWQLLVLGSHSLKVGLTPQRGGGGSVEVFGGFWEDCLLGLLGWVGGWVGWVGQANLTVFVLQEEGFFWQCLNVLVGSLQTTQMLSVSTFILCFTKPALKGSMPPNLHRLVLPSCFVKDPRTEFLELLCGTSFRQGNFFFCRGPLTNGEILGPISEFPGSAPRCAR